VSGKVLVTRVTAFEGKSRGRLVQRSQTFDLKGPGRLQNMHSKTNMICFLQIKPDLILL